MMPQGRQLPTKLGQILKKAEKSGELYDYPTPMHDNSGKVPGMGNMTMQQLAMQAARGILKKKGERNIGDLMSDDYLEEFESQERKGIAATKPKLPVGLRK